MKISPQSRIDLRVSAQRAHPHTAPIFSLSSPKGGEGWGEEAQLFPAQIPSPQPSPRSGGERETGASGCAPVILRAFTLIEVMVALGIFFVCVFSILGVLSNGLKNARRLQQKSADAGMVAAELSLSNIITEGLDSGDFGDMYPGYTWTRDVYEMGTNGLFQADIIVQKPGGALESKMSIYLYKPQSQKANQAGGANRGTAGKVLR